MTINPSCSICHGVGIVCECHPFAPWDDSISGGCECSAGMSCVCNKNNELPPSAVILIQAADKGPSND